MNQHTGIAQPNPMGISPMMPSPQQPQSQQSQGSVSSTGSLPVMQPNQQLKPSDASDNIAKVKSLSIPLRESLAVSAKTTSLYIHTIDWSSFLIG